MPGGEDHEGKGKEQEQECCLFTEDVVHHKQCASRMRRWHSEGSHPHEHQGHDHKRVEHRHQHRHSPSNGSRHVEHTVERRVQVPVITATPPPLERAAQSPVLCRGGNHRSPMGQTYFTSSWRGENTYSSSTRRQRGAAGGVLGLVADFEARQRENDTERCGGRARRPDNNGSPQTIAASHSGHENDGGGRQREGLPGLSSWWWQHREKGPLGPERRRGQAATMEDWNTAQLPVSLVPSAATSSQDPTTPTTTTDHHCPWRDRCDHLTAETRRLRVRAEAGQQDATLAAAEIAAAATAATAEQEMRKCKAENEGGARYRHDRLAVQGWG